MLLIDASVIGASAVTLATSYAFGDVFGIRHSLHRSWRDAKLFYGVFTVVVVLASGIVLIPDAPLGLITTAVQALAGTLLPSASLFLLLLCNDPAVLGPWVNRPWLNVLATVILAILVMLSLILVFSTIFSGRQRHPAADRLRRHPGGRAGRDRHRHPGQPGPGRLRARARRIASPGGCRPSPC